MPLVLVISSYVAASRVGGGIAPYVLGPMKVDPVLIPTCLFGRHPGRGAPGGSRVEVETMRGMFEGIRSNGLLPMVDIVLTGHFSAPEQAAFAGWVIDEVRAARGIDAAPPTIVVDPILGDEGKGYYVQPRVAQAINRELISRAGLVAPNLWEFSEIVQAPFSDLTSPEAVAARARAHGGAWLISSVPDAGGRIGALYCDGFNALFADAPRIAEPIPNGTGDLLTLRFVGGMANDVPLSENLARSVGATAAVIGKALDWHAPELPLAACSDLLANPPPAPIRRVE